MKLAMALSSLFFSFSSFAAPPVIADVLLTCTESRVEGTKATVHLDLVRAGGVIYLNSSLKMIPEFIPMKRTSAERMLGAKADYNVGFVRIGGENFKLHVERAFDPNVAWELTLKLKCVAPKKTTVHFCESYENFEECKQRDSGPDDVNDGDGGREADPENPDHPGDGGF